MTAAEFRKIALSLPEAVEASHMGHPDFRVRGKIFATLGYPSKKHAVLMVSPEEQRQLIRANPNAFSAASGAWGRRGNAQVLLEAADANVVRTSIESAWRKAAPKRLSKLLSR